MRNFITNVVQLVNRSKIDWSHVEPFLLSQVVSVFPQDVRIQFVFNTARTPTTFFRVREFLANYEELLLQGFPEEIPLGAMGIEQITTEPPKETLAPVAANPTGAVPKKLKVNEGASSSQTGNGQKRWSSKTIQNSIAVS